MARTAQSISLPTWYIIPANHKPFAHLAAGYIIHEKLMEVKLAYPVLSAAQKKELLKANKMLENEMLEVGKE